MDKRIESLLLRELDMLRSKVRSGSCRLSDGECMKVIAQLAHQPMDMKEVTEYLGWPESKFKDYCTRGLMPKGARHASYDGLIWYRDEINDRLIKLINEQ